MNNTHRVWNDEEVRDGDPRWVFPGGVQITARPRHEKVPAHTVPDPAWQYVDDHGHLHVLLADAAREAAVSDPGPYPTLRRVVDDPGDEERPALWHYECKDCGETIMPGERTVPEKWEAKSPPQYEVVVDTGGGGIVEMLLSAELGESILTAPTARAIEIAQALMAAEMNDGEPVLDGRITGFRLEVSR